MIVAAEQAGADVTAGYVGGLNTTATPITTPYYQNGMCPVNVHWHLGAEHRSEGEYEQIRSDLRHLCGRTAALGWAIRRGRLKSPPLHLASSRLI